jgi:hypothetical protein
MSYTRWLYQHCPQTRQWPSVDIFALIQQAKAAHPLRMPEILLIMAWLLCFTLLYGFSGQPLPEFSEQGYFWSVETASVLLVLACFGIFLEHKIKRPLVQKTILELVSEHQRAKKYGEF